MVRGGISAAGVVLCLALAACGSSDGGGSSAATSTSGGGGAAEGKKIVMILPSLTNDFYLGEKSGMEAQAKALADSGADVEVVAGTGASVGSEVTTKIQDAVTRGADVIGVNAGSDPDTIRPAIERALSQGVQVVLFDLPIPELRDRTTFVGVDNEKGGQLAGEWLTQHVRAGATLGVLHCLPGNPITDARYGGFKTAIEGAGIRTVSVLDARCDREQGRTKMENMLSANPDVEAIYSLSDTQTLGAVQALRAAGKDPLLISWDAQPDALKEIQDGSGPIDAEIGQSPFQLGALAVKTAVDVAAGRTVAASVAIPLTVVERDTADQFAASQNELP